MTRIGLGKLHALNGKAVDVRSADLGLTLIAHLAPTEVIRHEQNDIGPFCRWTRRFLQTPAWTSEQGHGQYHAQMKAGHVIILPGNGNRPACAGQRFL
jgi:hypothetical protein